ncbi:MAG: hypothetical protein WED82_01885 [Balneolales bacterium]
MAETVRIKVVIDSKDAKKGSKESKEYLLDIKGAAEDTQKSTKQLGLGTVTAGNLMAMAYAKVAQHAMQVINQTRELAFQVEETGSKYETVLGPNVAKANKFLEENAGLLGVATSEGQEFVATSVQIARGLGMQEDAAADFGIEWTKLAGDFQSFFNVPFEQGFGAIRSGLVGETEPLKQFGIVLRETEVSERALMMSGKQRKEELTEVERVQARYNLIVEQAGVAVGDLERTQQSAANQTRRMQAAYREVAEQLASRTLPIWQRVAGTGLDVAESILAMIEPTNKISRSYRQASVDVDNFRQNSLPLLEQYDDLTEKTELTNEEQEDLDEVIQRLAEHVPITAQEFDKFGRVIGINTEQAREYYEQLRRIEKTRNSEEIDRISESIMQQAAAAQNASDILNDYQGYQRQQSEQAAKGARVTVQSAVDVLAARKELNKQLEVGLESLKALGLTQEDINKQFSAAVKLSGWMFEAQSESNEATEEGTGLVEEQGTNLQKQKKRLDELINVQGDWTQAQMQEALEIYKKIAAIEGEIKAREKLLQLLAEGPPQKPDTAVNRPTDPTSLDIDIPVQEIEFKPLVDTTSIEQLHSIRSNLEQQFTETTSSEERSRLLERINTMDQYVSAAEQGITHEQFMRREAHQETMQQVAEYAQAFGQAYSLINQFQSVATENRIQKTNQEKEAALSAIDARLNNDKLSEKERSQLLAQREQAEAEYQKKIDDLQSEQFERERKAKLFEIAMNTAVAVSKVWGQTGLGGVLAQAAPIAMGLAQAAIVAKQANPYFTGGLVEERLKDGLSSPGKKLISINEDNRPEFIMNAASTAAALPILTRMNNDPGYAEQITRAAGGQTPVAPSRSRAAERSLDTTAMTTAVSAGIRNGLQGLVLEARVAISEMSEKQRRWEDLQKEIGN